MYESSADLPSLLSSSFGEPTVDDLAGKGGLLFVRDEPELGVDTGIPAPTDVAFASC